MILGTLIALALNSTPAYAGYYTTTMFIPHDAPTVAGDRVIVRHLGNAATGYSDQVINSTWSYLTCHIEDEELTVVFTADTSDWPSSIPSSATCTSGNDTLSISIVNDTLPDALDAGRDIGTGGIVVEAREEFAVMRKHRLASSLDLVEDSYDGVLGGNTWAGVTCLVANDAQDVPWVKVNIAYDAVEGDGSCVIDKVGGGTHSIPIDLSR